MGWFGRQKVSEAEFVATERRLERFFHQEGHKESFAYAHPNDTKQGLLGQIPDPTGYVSNPPPKSGFVDKKEYKPDEFVKLANDYMKSKG